MRLKKKGLERTHGLRVKLFFKCVLETVSFPDFKVCINAAVALGNASSKATFGEFYFLIMESLVVS